MQLIYRPIDNWTSPPTTYRGTSRFKSAWNATLGLLERELDLLKAESAILMVDVPASAITMAGSLKGDVSPKSPRVVLLIERKNGRSLRYPCDKFDNWRANVRAIALSLEALRKVDSYGVTGSGEQYRGWEALPAPGATFSSAGEAREFLRSIIGSTFDAVPILAAIRECERRTHPDAGGDVEKFKKVQQARALLLP